MVLHFHVFSVIAASDVPDGGATFMTEDSMEQRSLPPNRCTDWQWTYRVIET